MCARRASESLCGRLYAYDTAACDTPAAFATSCIVGIVAAILSAYRHACAVSGWPPPGRFRCTRGRALQPEIRHSAILPASFQPLLGSFECPTSGCVQPLRDPASRIVAMRSNFLAALDRWTRVTYLTCADSMLTESK